MGDAVTQLVIFLLAIVLMAAVAGPVYMRLLAHGARPDEWWRGRRDGAFWVGLALLLGGAVFYAIGGVGAITFAWLLIVSAAFNLAVAGYCQLALRRLPDAERGPGARARVESAEQE
jgi:hypothetical protein